MSYRYEGRERGRRRGCHTGMKDGERGRRRGCHTGMKEGRGEGGEGVIQV